MRSIALPDLAVVFALFAALLRFCYLLFCWCLQRCLSISLGTSRRDRFRCAGIAVRALADCGAAARVRSVLLCPRGARLPLAGGGAAAGPQARAHAAPLAGVGKSAAFPVPIAVGATALYHAAQAPWPDPDGFRPFG